MWQGKGLVRRDSLLEVEMPDLASLSLLQSRNLETLTEASQEHDLDDLMSTFGSAEDSLFDLMSEGTGKVYLSRFVLMLQRAGLRKDDRRLQECMTRLKAAQKLLAARGKDVGLDKETFKQCVSPNIVLIKRAFERDLVIPEFERFAGVVEELYELCKQDSSGKVAEYIPQLARADPNHWGVSVCTVDGQRYSCGDVTIPVCLQSTSMPLTYAFALSDLGEELVHEYIGQEPSGGAFNELKLDANNKPHNPMINAGAIITVSLTKPEASMADRFDYISQQFKRLAGGEFIGFNNAVYLSERATADRNFAIAYYMKEKGCFPEKTDLKKTLDLYFQMCSVEVTCESASMIAATLANGGLCPVTGEQVLCGDAVRNTLALMHSCGMYEYSGQFAFKVGLPAKSGVSGVIMLVIPNVMGICLWSPPLDNSGNSVRGLEFCDQLVNTFNFHMYDCLEINKTKKSDPVRLKCEQGFVQIYELLLGASKGDVSTLKRMSLSGVDMSVSDYDGRTALHIVASEGHLDCVEFLLVTCGVPHLPRDRWNHTPLDEASKFGHKTVEEYLERWANDHPEYEENNGNT